MKRAVIHSRAGGCWSHQAKPWQLITAKRPKRLTLTNVVEKGEVMGTILLILLILLLIGALPAWPYSSGWGYWPSGGLGLILLIVMILALTRRL